MAMKTSMPLDCYLSEFIANNWWLIKKRLTVLSYFQINNYSKGKMVITMSVAKYIKIRDSGFIVEIEKL